MAQGVFDLVLETKEVTSSTLLFHHEQAYLDANGTAPGKDRKDKR